MCQVSLSTSCLCLVSCPLCVSPVIYQIITSCVFRSLSSQSVRLCCLPLCSCVSVSSVLLFHSLFLGLFLVSTLLLVCTLFCFCLLDFSLVLSSAFVATFSYFVFTLLKLAFRCNYLPACVSAFGSSLEERFVGSFGLK